MKEVILFAAPSWKRQIYISKFSPSTILVNPQCSTFLKTSFIIGSNLANAILAARLGIGLASYNLVSFDSNNAQENEVSVGLLRVIASSTYRGCRTDNVNHNILAGYYAHLEQKVNKIPFTQLVR